MPDARNTLERFMVGGAPDDAHFRDTIEPLLRQSTLRSGGRRPNVFGEMVDLLWRDGQRSAAIQLEECWNDLALHHEFDLLCAYAMDGFGSAADGAGFSSVCRQHSRVIPTEQFTQVADDAQLAEISSLQQRAKALEGELSRRRQLEHDLRVALDRERSARGEAVAANRAKNEFLAKMSHELRTPLNAIGGHAQLMQLGMHGPLTDAQRQALSRIERSQRHLLALINDVLNVAHIESGRVSYEIEVMLLEPLVADVVATIEPLVAGKSISTELVVQPRADGGHARAVRADRDKLRQILFNLLSNAIKFTPSGGRITVELADGGSDDRVCVHVEDTGIGIEPAEIERVFEPFVQLGTRQFAPTEGLGLGLAISRDLARSTPGKGSRFTLTLEHDRSVDVGALCAVAPASQVTA
jgi:signal transduction histidine kinase